MHTTVVSRGGEDSTDGEPSNRWAEIVDADPLSFHCAGAKTAAGVAYLVFALAPMWWTPHPPRPGMAQTGIHGLATLTANCFLAAGLAFLAYMTVVAWRAAPRPLGPKWLARR